MIVLLLALVIVAWLAKDALLAYMKVPTGATTAVTPGERARMPAAAAAAGDSIDAVSPSPAWAMDKARSLEKAMQQDAAKRGGEN